MLEATHVLSMASWNLEGKKSCYQDGKWCGQTYRSMCRQVVNHGYRHWRLIEFAAANVISRLEEKAYSSNLIMSWCVHWIEISIAFNHVKSVKSSRLWPPVSNLTCLNDGIGCYNVLDAVYRLIVILLSRIKLWFKKIWCHRYGMMFHKDWCQTGGMYQFRC